VGLRRAAGVPGQRFYLTDRSLFLLVWNSRARAADGKVIAWLDAITARAP
jgi:internalin A